MKKRISELSERERIATLDALYTATSSLRTREDMKMFLRDLLTESERVMLGRRILIARLLLQQETAESIRSRTGAGFATIERVRKWLLDQVPGYEQAIAEMERSFRARRKVTSRDLWRMLGRKYPLHFLLFPEPTRKPRSQKYKK